MPKKKDKKKKKTQKKKTKKKTSRHKDEYTHCLSFGLMLGVKIIDAHKDKANTRQNKNIKDPQKKYRFGTDSKIFYWRA